MSFESLSYRYVLKVNDFPQRWLPLVFLYDPDLPLFPISYFHVLAENQPLGNRPGYSDRAFGYIERVNQENDYLAVHIVCNKDLNLTANDRYLTSVTQAIRGRLGISNPVILNDVATAFTGYMADRNQVLIEIWCRVVSTGYGDMLPFGQLWDPILGLARYVASWNSPGGRKGELIQTHYFALRFGESIQSAGGIPQTDFHLLPTFQEMSDISNPLNLFPSFRALCEVGNLLKGRNILQTNILGLSLSKFTKGGGRLDTKSLLALFSQLPYPIRDAAIECFNAFDKGPQRTIIYLLMAADLRSGTLLPATIPAQICGALYSELSGTYQSPKTINIYAQQAHGNPAAMPVDTWVETFLKWPLALYPQGGREELHKVFANSSNLGKVERLIWVTSQARKVHSSACDDALLCMKYGASAGGNPRGANPLACNICLGSIRQVCPAYLTISDRTVIFNSVNTGNQFRIDTSLSNNTTPNQTFIRCTGYSLYENIVDEFSPVDESQGFSPYPQMGHDGSPLTVAQFIDIY